MHSLIIAGSMIRRTIGHRKGFISLVLLPAVVLSGIVGIFGSSHQDSEHAVAVWNADTGPLGDVLVQAARSSSAEGEQSLNVISGEWKSEDELNNAVKEGKADLGIYVPADFSSKLQEGGRPQVRLLRKEVQPWNAAIEQKLSAEAAQLAAFTQAAALAGEGSKAPVLERLLGERDNHHIGIEPLKSAEGKHRVPFNVLINGIMLMFMMLAINQSVQVVMEDREKRTMARMFAAPLRGYEIALGNFIGSMLVGTIQLVIVLAASRFIIGYDYGIGFFPHLIILECFLLATVGLATAVAGLVRNTDQLSQLNNLVVTPTCMLGGCFWPISIMPDFMQKLANFIPQKWAMEALSRMAFGSTLTDTLLPLGIMLLFAAVMLAFGAYILQPSRSAA
ncbi:ABC transporter permease [Paenibacillus sepulcri]|uniref:ABC transporter permease n=1 Tax=Paenibacillus sepulcri TaxID=359917 RepID=A0ABS7C0R9_9BACL|nr:ABC transporter permease [Paenibacillus sepulcri]